MPTVGIVTRRFGTLFESRQRSMARETFPMAIVEPTITELTPEQAREVVTGVIDDIVRALTRPQAVTPPGRAAAEDLLRYEGRDLLQAERVLNTDFLDRGWGDGFPLLPPTPEAVEEMLSGTSRNRNEVVTVLEPGRGLATVEKIAINCVMAGCRPEHLPVVIAAVEAINAPEFNLPLIAQSTGPHAPLLIINGPIRQELGINCGGCALGPGAPSRVNTVIGRAVRLIMMNVGLAYPNIMDMDTIGSPNKYSMCVGENEERNPWEPLHVQRGFPREADTVTVFPGTSLSDVADVVSCTAEDLLYTFIHNANDSTSTAWSWTLPVAPGWNRDALILFCPEHARVLADAGWTKQDIQERMFEKARIPLRCIKQQLLRPGKLPVLMHLLDEPDDTLVQIVREPEDFHIVVVGGSGAKSAYIDGMGEPVTREIRK
ncbi:MAG: hypothetical protein HYX92_21785 [Chloroflexi bacterium]|nr:hypothetical protein [Chloroflexota bacterium]